MANDNVATFKVYVDWNKDGDYSDSNEDITAYVMEADWQLGFKEPYASMSGATRATIRLDNSSQVFSPENSGGALYGSNWATRPFKIDAIYSGGTVTLFTGWTDDVRPDVTNRGKTATMTAYGADWLLKRKKFSVPVLTDVTADEVISEILETAKIIPATTDGPWLLGISGNSELGTTTYLQDSGLTSSLETGRVPFAYVGDTWTEDTPAYTAIGEIVEAERGKCFIDRAGQLVFWNNAHLLSITTLDETFDNTFLSASYEYIPEGTTHNVIEVAAQPRTVDDDITTLWELDAPVTIEAQSTKQITAHLADQTSEVRVAAIEVQTPNSSDGTLAFSQGNASISRFDPKMVNVIVELRNDSTTDAVCDTLTIKGRALTAYNKATIIVQDAESVVTLGERRLSMGIDLLQSESFARNVAGYELRRRSTARGELSDVTFISKEGTLKTAALVREIGDRVRVIEDQTAHDDEYFIVGERHRLTDGMNRHEYTWALELADAQQYWLLNTANYGELGQATYIGPL